MGSGHFSCYPTAVLCYGKVSWGEDLAKCRQVTWGLLLGGSLNLKATGPLVFGEQEQLASEFVPDGGMGLIFSISEVTD